MPLKIYYNYQIVVVSIKALLQLSGGCTVILYNNKCPTNIDIKINKNINCSKTIEINVKY